MCNSCLEVQCGTCNCYVEYSHFGFSRHSKRHKSDLGTSFDSKESSTAVLKVAYVTSQWTDEEGGRLLMGQYSGACEQGAFDVRVLRVKDPTGDFFFADTYDALWSKVLSARDHYEVVKVYTSYGNFKKDLRDKRLPIGLDILIVGDWTHPSASSKMNDVAGMYEQLREAELDHGFYVFPPLDYAWYFAQKVSYYQKLKLCLTSLSIAHTIPTLTLPKSRSMWERVLSNWDDMPKDKCIVIKRDLSDQSHHVVKCEVSNLPAKKLTRTSDRWPSPDCLNSQNIGNTECM